MSTEERLNGASAAGKRATTSPYERQAKSDNAYKVWLTFVWTFQVVIAVWLGNHGAPWWMVWGWWTLVVASIFLSMLFRPLAGRIRRRQMLLAREQVHQVRKLDAGDPVGLGLGHLFDADPDLDRLSAEAGVRFALARVNAVLDEVETATPEPTFAGYTMSDDGKARKR